MHFDFHQLLHSSGTSFSLESRQPTTLSLVVPWFPEAVRWILCSLASVADDLKQHLHSLLLRN